MKAALFTADLRFEQDVALIRQRARQIAGLLGFDAQDQTRIATAVSEIVRNAFQYAGGGKVTFRLVEGTPQVFEIGVKDSGPGFADPQTVLDGRYVSQTGMGLGVIGARRLMDDLQITSSPGQGTLVVLRRRLPRRAESVTSARLAKIAEELARRAPEDPLSEVLRQNQELMRALEELQMRQEELARLNLELEDTNRGVLALYAELDDKAESLKRASEQKTRFLSNMSHEFRTPLNAILSLSRILLDRMDGELTPEQQKQVGYIRKSAQDLSELVNDLLDLAKVEAGKISVRTSSFQVADLFGALRATLRPLLPENSAVSLLFDDPADIPLLTTDEGKVSQILRNFISNALKYTEQGEVRVAAKRENNAVVYSVADTGIGISPEDQERIFEEFIQLENRLQNRFKGTGLGLPLSRKLAELLGGSVGVQSAPGVGSTFTLTLPILLPGGEAQEVGLPSETLGEILIIDDDEISRYLLRGILTDVGYRILEADSGPEGLLMAQKRLPLAIFLDLIMPEMDGFEVLDRLRSDPATQDIPVVIHTSKSLEPEERERLFQGTAVILPKQNASRDAALLRISEALRNAALLRSPEQET